MVDLKRRWIRDVLENEIKHFSYDAHNAFLQFSLGILLNSDAVLQIKKNLVS
jgi:hypothetical protein